MTFKSKGYAPLVSFFILLIAAYLIYVTVRLPFVGVNVEKNRAGQWEISEVSAIGWANEVGIRPGDILVKVDDKPVSFHRPIQTFGVIGDAERLTISREGNRLTYPVSDRVDSGTMLYHAIFPSLVFGVLLLFCSFIYVRKKNDRTALMLIAFLIAVGFSYLSAGTSARTDIPARLVNGLALLMIPVVFIHFLHHYFMRFHLSFIRLRFLIVFYVVNLLVVLTDTVAFFVLFGEFYTVIRHLQLALFSFEMLLCCALLIIFYIRYRGTSHKPVIQNMVFGILVSFLPFVFFTALPSTFLGIQLIPPSVSASFLIFLPAFFLYLVLTNRLFDIDFIVGRLRYYSVISLFLTAVMIGLLFVTLNQIHSWVPWVRLLIVLYLSLVGSFYFEEKFSFRFRRKLFPERYNFQFSLDRFSRDISRVLSTDELEKRLIREVKDVLLVRDVSVLKFDKETGELFSSAGEKHSFTQHLNPAWKERLKTCAAGESLETGDGICYVICEKSTALHLLWVERKVNLTPFNRDERVWLKTLAQYASIVYENFQLMDGLAEDLKRSITQNQPTPSWLLRLLFNLSEKERARLASDLHDSALQEQLIWYRRVEDMLSDSRLPSAMKEELERVKEGLLDVIHQIRETCTLLRPPFLNEMGIVEALDHLLQYYRLRTDFVIDFDTGDFDASLNHEQALVIYRIVQELLTNAAKHSGAQHVRFQLKTYGRAVVLHYRDDGVGVNMEKLDASYQHMGLAGIRQRVKSLHGTVDFSSPPEGGFRMKLTLPIHLRTESYFKVV